MPRINRKFDVINRTKPLSAPPSSYTNVPGRRSTYVSAVFLLFCDVFGVFCCVFFFLPLAKGKHRQTRGAWTRRPASPRHVLLPHYVQAKSLCFLSLAIVQVFCFKISYLLMAFHSRLFFIFFTLRLEHNTDYNRVGFNCDTFTVKLSYSALYNFLCSLCFFLL